MTDRKFRFGLVAAPNLSGDAWVALARRSEALGYDTLLVPDTPDLGSPLPAAALAAGATTTLRVGTFVLVAPVRQPTSIARDATTLDRLTGGRFELGLGTGRPGADELAAILGTELPPPAERVDRVADVVRAVREQGDATRILIAGTGTRILTLAGQVADTVSFALPPSENDAALERVVTLVRDAAGDRFDQVELATNLVIVGEREVPGVSAWLGGTPAELAAAGSIAVLLGSPAEMADRLARRRDALGVSYVTLNATSIDDFAPVVERLAGT
ncbi:LLM class flavin-dependent oxidoreductase [Cryptosporangium aurantiacum]|uniref:Probable F420-dependent oxidoreductase, MSMEG_2516 family n=1 Tax=Cryptosporangium aurantiacum TaxID=134849 RepID=A0A1M7QD03_9ACTN|nr:LLM class flavin-dependent oxidoreductase [Cryptosporangium aurantiacum]SHN28712.1 probable F420-dependent oxidoreductase, MSMEG_2516 family [Cryptosporangium aurantiacum]